jgi:L-threonylcarbamoyladenylate synthase
MKILSVYETTALLKSGGVVIVPTDSCYGLAGDAMNRDVFQRVLSLKGRTGTRPPALFVADLKSFEALVLLKKTQRKQVESLLPGPVTLLLNPRPEIPSWLSDPHGRIGIRMIKHSPFHDVLIQTGLFLTATSANKTGQPPPYTMDDLRKSPLLSAVDGVLTGSCGGLRPSTVIDFSGERPVLIREGPIDFLEAIQ